jgi:hypothetical protein
VAALLPLAGCSATSTPRATPSTTVVVTTPTPAQQAATLHATNVFRQEIVTAASSIAPLAQRVVGDLAVGNVAAAQRDTAQLQVAYNTIRPVITANSATDLSLDGWPSDQPKGVAPTGIRVLAADLAARRLDAARRQASWVAEQGPTLTIGLFRTIETPQQIAQRVVSLLSWTVESVIAHPRSTDRRQDLADVLATASTAKTAIVGMEQLGLLVDPPTTYLVQDRLHAVTMALGGLGEPQQLTAAQIDAVPWRTIAQHLDALAAAVGTLGGSMSGYGTGRPYA